MYIRVRIRELPVFGARVYQKQAVHAGNGRSDSKTNNAHGTTVHSKRISHGREHRRFSKGQLKRKPDKTS